MIKYIANDDFSSVILKNTLCALENVKKNKKKFDLDLHFQKMGLF